MASEALQNRDFLISDLCHLLEEYLEEDQVREVYRAYLFGAEAHEGQMRLSGEPYIYHPITVARILAEQRLDHQTVIAAILHDVIEDTPTAKEQIAGEFGEEVAELVDGVSKLTQIQFESQEQKQAENFRKMILAMTRDIRVILIKLADRLHNMRTLGSMPPHKRRRIARETLDIYVPIATRLGMNTLRIELEELVFQNMYPMRYRVLDEAVRKARGNRKEIVQKIETGIKRRLHQEGLDGEVIGREKHLFSIYQKIRDKTSTLSEVFDVYAFRIIVDSVDACYRVLGVVHNLYKPVPGKFKDYIAIPKANGYQSLHTILFGPYGVPIEVQIRTREMHTVAEHGIAAHWRYKTGDTPGSTDHVRAREWMMNILEMQKSAGDSLEFIENLRIDLFPDEVYVFTPKGQIMELPRGATAVDFAYAVHTDIGNSCVAAKIDRRLAPLRTPLMNGQYVEIITAPNAKPNPAWLNFVFTAKARSNIRHFLKNLRRDEAVSLGKRLLDKALALFALSTDEVPKRQMKRLLKQYKLESLDDLLFQIGLGERMPQIVARLLAPDEEGKTGAVAGEPSIGAPLAITGTEGMVVSYAKCCRPIPGDPIIGYVTAGRGIVIHNESCKNVADFRKYPEKWIDVKWEEETKGDFPVDLRVHVSNQRGVLATVAAAIADMGANIENVGIEERDGKYSTMTFTLDVRDRKHLAEIMRRIRALDQVIRINRVHK
ncbi:MAG: bifunctional GTP diphosphokinase/guanosine-3',5'-bis pyrophosphate 3'-pyrophosphohydrolase [Granulosicoccaceae bacterium]|jgi:RelA/SpoT family (p)ppGpp synthetase